MGKRSNFVRRPNDKYPTFDKRVVPPLLRHLEPGEFVEPCAGDGTLIDLLEPYGWRCTQAFDLVPGREDIEQGDAMTARLGPGRKAVTNPPWSRDLLHPIIENLAAQGETWLLFDAAWAFTRQARPWLRLCHKIIVVGRLKWVPDTPHDAQDDCAWYLFGPDAPAGPGFYGRD